MEPTSLIIGGVLGAGAVTLFGKKKTAPRKPRATTAKKRVAKKPVAKKAPAKKPTAKRAVAKKKAVAPKGKQIGSSNRSKDKLHQAKKPGKRISASGNVYYESRANRSDVNKYL